MMVSVKTDPVDQKDQDRLLIGYVLLDGSFHGKQATYS